MRSRRFGKLTALLLCLVLITGQHGVTSLGAVEGPEYEGMPTEEKDTTKEAAKELTPTPTGEAEELTPTPTEEAEEELTPTPTEEAEEETAPAPTEEAKEEASPAPTEEAEEEASPAPTEEAKEEAPAPAEPEEDTTAPEETDPAGPQETPGTEGDNTEEPEQPEEGIQQPEGGQPQEDGSQMEEPEENGTEAGDLSEDDEEEVSAVAEVSQDAETVKVRSVNFRETGAPYLNGNNYIEDKNVVYFSLEAEVSDYEYEFSGGSFSESFSGTEVTKSVASNRSGWYALNGMITEGGTYTLKVKKGEEVVGTGDVDIYKVTFDPAPGQFSDRKGSYTGYGMKDDAWRYYDVPSVPKNEGGGEYLGWATEPNQANYEKIVYTAGAAAGGSHDVTVYAAYGMPKTYGAKLTDSQGQDIADSQLAVRLDADSSSVKLNVVNTGNQPLFQIGWRGIHNYTLSFDKDAGELKAGESLGITLTPKELAKGQYTDYLWIEGAKSSGGSTSTFLFVIITTEVTSASAVTVKPAALEKSYGEEKKASDVEVTLDKEGIEFKDLGVSLRNDGFAAGAKPGTYEYYLSGSSSKYDVTLDKTNVVTVKKAVPQNGGVNAGAVHTEGTLGDSALSGTFTNPHNGVSVTGELTWTEGSDTILNETGEHKWKFTPTGQDKDNYESIEGEAVVQVTERTPRTLAVDGPTEFTYDGNPHSLAFTADGEGAITAEYQVGDAWVTDPPKAPGTYAVKASIEAAGAYAEATCEASLTITQREIGIGNYYVLGKVYDGTEDVAVDKINVSLSNKVKGEDVGVTVTARYDKKDAGSRNVAITLGELTGKDAGNYRLPAKVTYHTTAMISPVVIRIKAAELSKEYGVARTLSVSDFEVTGLLKGETVPLEFSCDGTGSAADAGSYPIKALLRSGGNYTFTGGATGLQSVEAGTLTVTKATPKPSMNGVHAGEGKRGGSLRNVALNGLFVNPNDDTMDVPGTLAWSNPETVLPEADSFEAEWTFIPTDTDNYNSPVTGSAAITLEALQPFQVTVSEKAVTYDGTEQIIEPKVADADKEKAELVVEYRLHKDIVVRAIALMASDGHEDYVTEPPTDAGFYDVHVHAYVKDGYKDQYADNLVETTLEIIPAVPKVKEQTTIAVSEGTILIGDLEGLMEAPADIEGKPLEGEFDWVSEGTPITAEGKYAWTFTPTDPNYSPVSGTTSITLAEDSRTISAVVYNLPNALSYSDYAVVDIEKSNLKVGETVTFYETADCKNPESDSVPVTEETGTMRVALDGDALADSDGIIYARITSSTMHQADEVTYPPELGFTVPDSIATTVGGSTELAVELSDESYTEGCSISITVNEGDVITVENGTTQNALIKGVRAGSAAIQVMVTFPHPDKIYGQDPITITKTVHALVEETTGSLSISKTVVAEGDEVDPEKAFTFTVSLTDSEGTPLEGETTYGSTAFKNGIAEIELRDGQTEVISGISGGVKYTVTEKEDADYISEAKDDTGVITVGSPAAAAFINTKKPTPTPTVIPSVTPEASPSPTPTVIPSVTPEASPSATPTVIPSVTPEATPSATPEVSPSATPTVIPSVTPEASPSATPEVSPSVTPEVTPSATPEVSPSVTPTVIPSATPEVSPSVTPEATPSITPEVSPSATPEATPSATPEVTPSATPEVIPSATPEVTPSATPEVSPSTTPEATPSATPEVTPSATPEVIPSTTPETTPSATPEATPSATPEVTPSATPETTPSATPEATPSATPEVSPSTTPEVTPSATPEVTPSATPEATPSATPEVIPSVTPEATPSAAPEVSPSATPEVSPSTAPEVSVTPEPSTEPEPETQTKVTQTEGLDAMEIPEELKDAGLDDPEVIAEEMKRTVVAGGHTGSEEDIAVYDVEMQISVDGGTTWVPATKENFPVGGLTLTIPYPADTDGNYSFVVTHMFTHAMNGYQAGEVEVCSAVNTAEGIQFVVHGLSPIAVAWEEPAETPEITGTPEPTEEPEVTGTPEPTEEPEVTETPEPTETPEVTETPEPTEAPEVTETPEPTEEPEATETPEPTETPEATETPEPTVTPESTATPAPTWTPAAAYTPGPTGTPGPKAPATGDETPVARWFSLLLLSGGLLALLLLRRRKSNE